MKVGIIRDLFIPTSSIVLRAKPRRHVCCRKEMIDYTVASEDVFFFVTGDTQLSSSSIYFHGFSNHDSESTSPEATQTTSSYPSRVKTAVSCSHRDKAAACSDKWSYKSNLRVSIQENHPVAVYRFDGIYLSYYLEFHHSA